MITLVCKAFVISTILLAIYDFMKANYYVSDDNTCSKIEFNQKLHKFVKIILLITIVIFFIMAHIRKYVNYCRDFEKYQSENVQIEQEIEDIVKANLILNEETNNKIIWSQNYINICLSIPELSSNEIIQEKIEKYNDNEKKINELKVTLEGYNNDFLVKLSDWL